MNPIIAQWLVTVLTRLLCVYFVVQGVNIIVGGEQRWATNSYSSVAATYGAPESWGALLAAFGVVAAIGLFVRGPGWLATGLFLGAAWNLGFAWGFAHAWWRFDTSSSTAHWVYLLLAVVSVLLAVAHVLGHVREPGGEEGGP